MLMGMQVHVKNTPCTIMYCGSYLKLENKKTGATHYSHPFSRPILSAKCDKYQENMVKIKLEKGGMGWIPVNDTFLVETKKSSPVEKSDSTLLVHYIQDTF
jgi:hypothetical protein